MKQSRTLFLLAFLCLQALQSSYAYDFKVDGIAYNIISTSNLEVEAEGDFSDKDYWKEVIVVPESVTYEGVTFHVTAIKSSVFTQGYGNNLLKEVYLPNTITAIPPKCFSSCPNLVKIVLPNALTSIGERAFSGCSSLNNLNLPSSVTRIDSYAFQDCKSLNSIELPPKTEEMGAYVFKGCTGLTSIFIPKFFGRSKNGSYCLDRAFVDCKRLKTVVFDNDYMGDLHYYLGTETFSQCDSLESVSLPDNIYCIGYRTFYGCSSLSSITLPNYNLYLTIENEAFYECNQLKRIVSLSNTPPQIGGSKRFSGTTLLNGTLYVPKGCVSDYRNAEGWKEFVNIHEIGEEESFTLTAYCNKGGSLNINGQTICNQILSIDVSKNQSITIAITPDEDYHIKSVTLNGKDVKDDLYNNIYKIAQIKENMDFRVEFARTATYLSLKQPSGSMDIVVKEGESQTVRLVPESGYTIHSVTYNGVDVTSQLSSDNVFVTPEITENSVLYVAYENGDNPPENHAKYLTIKHSENGVVKQRIVLGRSYTYKISPVSGQRLAALYFNGVDVTSEIKGGKFTTPVLNDNATLEVEFEAR